MTLHQEIHQKIHVKICGITNLADARVAMEAGADLLGFIFYPKSPRYVEPEEAAHIVAGLRQEHDAARLPRFVGVFVNEPMGRVAALLAEIGLDYAQLHGDETPEQVASLPGHGFKALRPADNRQAEAEAARFASLGPADGPRYLLDAYDPAAYGGTGRRADWQVAASLARRYPGLLLAGGLTPANVATAVQAVAPWGVDVSSGVEAAPGRKDHDAVRAFIRQVRQSWPGY
ncbi:phosphoribosylanthranilate isomerase [Litorilinea aerophila]|uniref:N-(5'-phosphoribosyl)anthranilate isomerase n=1 Tax=Litorilinea aerophila TaxID=1204385 RepID=A0A540VFV2_9CHLR|nr:phosphoribosylanthranilate isomerase [Litorilinea aerophila]